jgi:hypothetical protein
LSATLHRPTGVTVDGAGDVFFTDPSYLVSLSDTRVYEIIGGSLAAVAGDVTALGLNPGDGGSANGVLLGDPTGIAASPTGNVYFSDAYFDRVRILNGAGTSDLSISSGGILNAASLTPGPVAPPSIATLFGSFGPVSPSQAAGVPLPTALTGLAIQFQSGGSIYAPLFFVSAGQVNVQVPWELSGPSAARVSEVLNGTIGSSQTVSLAPFAPAIFATNGQGTGQGVIVDSAYQTVDSLNPASPEGPRSRSSAQGWVR